MAVKRILFLIISCFVLNVGTVFSQTIRNYIFFGLDRDGIHDSLFLKTSRIEGAQLKYYWKELEPEKDRYDFDLIQKDLDFLSANNKKLFIQIQDVSFDSLIITVPGYLLKDPVYNGGVNSQYSFLNNDETKYTKGGWVARRWDSNVAFRFHKLLTELGKRFDGKIEGINLPETAVEFGEKSTLHPSGFTFDKYRDAIIENMRMAKEVFLKTTVIQYANFMPGEWLPSNDHSYLRSLFNYAYEIKCGMGGPDILVYKKGQMNNSYGFIHDSFGKIPTGVAVQDGNYDHINPTTGKRVSVQEIYDFGKDYLKLSFIFWCTQEPYYTKDVIPFLNSLEN